MRPSTGWFHGENSPLNRHSIARTFVDMRREHGATTRSDRIGLAVLGCCALVVAIVTTSIQDGSAIGAPAYWAWILTGIQVVGLRAAASGNASGWLIGASVQFPWIAYALVTAQFGFIPGCVISGVVQTHGYLRRHHSASRNHKGPIYA